VEPYDLNTTPFSLPGSFLTISSRSTATGTRLAYLTCSSRAVTRQDLPYHANDFFELALVRNGIEIPYDWSASPYRLDLIASGDASATFVFADADTILFETSGVNLRLMPAKAFNSWWQPSIDQIHLVDHPARGFHLLRATQGTHLLYSPSVSVYDLKQYHAARPLTIEFTGKSGAQGALRFSRFEGLWQTSLPDIDDTISTREHEYMIWQHKTPVVADCYQETAEQAWFLLWNCQVPAGGALTRPAIYMSKFWMNSIWAWDNCFNALAVAGADPHLAWQQLLLFFDHQEPNGMVPDMINDLEPIYGFTKPPIHGWTIRKLIEITGLTLSLPYLEKIYKPLSRLVDWWYEQRDFDHDGVPQYHHGNDSGWDNATVFDQGGPTEGADLAAYLVLQSEALAYIAECMGKPKAAVRWKERAENQLSALLKHSVHKHRFFSPRDGQTTAPASLSLLNSIPIILGKRLPDNILQTLSADLSPTGPYLTEWGYASEAPSSSKYEPDGYWRGPIWAPSTYLIVDGLIAAGKLDLAREAATRFCDLCVKQPGFWENYDALTGAGLRCPGYSWTASVFLLLASWLKKDEQPS
jgi:putative isomerase